MSLIHNYSAMKLSVENEHGVMTVSSWLPHVRFDAGIGPL